MKKLILLISCWSLAYFSSGKQLFGQDFGQDPDRFEIDREESDEEFYPVEPPFEDSRNEEDFEAPENHIEIVEPAPEEPEPVRPRRQTPPFQFGGGSRPRPSFQRPSVGSGSGSFGKASGDVRFKRTGQEQPSAEDPLAQKKENLNSLKEQFQETFGN